jgi:protein O-mannosyl-transferase
VLTASAPEFLYSVALLCLVTAILIRYRARVHPLYAIAFFLMLFPLIPTLYSPAISRFPFADRYLYFPSVGFSLFLALLLKRMIIYGVQKGQRRFAWGVAAVFVSVAVLASLGAVKKSLVWKDDLTLWSVSAGEDPENYYALYNIAIAYFRQGRLSEGIDKMERSVEANTLRAHPDRLMLVSAIESLARAYREAGYVEKSKKNYREVLRHSPMNSSAAKSLRDLCAQTGERGSLDQGNCFPVFPEPVLVSHPHTNLPS